MSIDILPFLCSGSGCQWVKCISGWGAACQNASSNTDCLSCCCTRTFTEQKPPCVVFMSITLPLMLLNISWISPIQAVSCNYGVKQGLCSRGNKACLWEGPQTSSCVYNRKCWQPFSSCWHAYRRVHTPHMPPLGIPKHAQTSSTSVPIQNILWGTAPWGTSSFSHTHSSIPVLQWCPPTHISRRVLVQNSREVRQVFQINTLVFYLALHQDSCPALYNLINMYQRREFLQRALLPIPRQHTTTVH